MKKIIYIFLIILSILTCFEIYNKIDVNSINSILTIEKKIGEEFYIPDSLQISNPDEMYDALNEISENLKINIFRQVISSNIDGNFQIEKYILLKNNTQFFNKFFINITNFKDEINNKDKYLSTENNNDENKIGNIYDFGNNDIIYIRPLSDLYQNYSVNGNYFVELPPDLSFNEFLETLTLSINNKFNSNFISNDFLITTESVQGIKNINNYLIFIRYSLLITIILLISYFIVNNIKKISVYKLNGISILKIYFIFILKQISIIYIVCIIISTIICCLFESNLNFIYTVIFYQLLNYLIVTLASFGSYLLISTKNINLGLKHKKNTNLIIFLNKFFKIILSIIIILISMSVITTFSKTTKLINNLNNWDKSSDYGMFYPLNIGEDNEIFKTTPYKFFAQLSNELYPILNDNGSILIESRSYEDETLKYYKENNMNVLLTLKINPNYLNEFPIYDINNNAISISEDETNTILLIPEKYKENEQEILSEMRFYRNAQYEYEEEVLLNEISPEIKNQDIQIIWIENDQKIFSFNSEVSKDDNNLISNPIVEVITLSNSVTCDRNTILGNGITDPLKIKLIDKNPKKTYDKLIPILKELNLDDNLLYFVNIDTLTSSQLYNLKTQLYFLYIIFIIFIILFFVVSIQYYSIIYNKNKKDFIVKRIFGIGFFKTYNKFLLDFFISWIIQIILILFINKNIVMNILLPIIYIIIDFLFLNLSIIILERKNKLSIIKGDK